MNSRMCSGRSLSCYYPNGKPAGDALLLALASPLNGTHLLKPGRPRSRSAAGVAHRPPPGQCPYQWMQDVTWERIWQALLSRWDATGIGMAVSVHGHGSLVPMKQERSGVRKMVRDQGEDGSVVDVRGLLLGLHRDGAQPHEIAWRSELWLGFRQRCIYNFLMARGCRHHQRTDGGAR